MNPVPPVPPSHRRVLRYCFQTFFACLLALGLGQSARAQQLAFPGAQGFGQFATGGRGGVVYHVTTLADSGTGSFRDAVSHSGRIIVFDVGGYINLQTAVSCSSSLTIAGQTAPGDGIGIMGAEVSFDNRANIICRHVRFRQGDIHNGSNANNAGESAINLGADSSTAPSTNMIFDHISVGFGSWDSVDAVNTTTFTVQNSIIANPINQQFGAHHEGSNASWIRNLWVNGHNRQPLAKANTVYINNVVYNFQAGYTTGDTGAAFSHDIVNNYFIAGPSTSSSGDDFFQINGTPQNLYFTGNILDSSADGILAGSATGPSPDNNGRSGNILASPWSPVTSATPTYSTLAAYRIDVSLSGTFPHDQVDQQVISSVTSLGAAGRIFNSEGDTGLGNSGYGVINGGIAAIDSDGDGMPDYWEKAMGLDPNNSSDAMTVGSDGYANIEHYLNWLGDMHAVTSTNAPITIDLFQYTGGFTNASAIYSVNNITNGTILLVSGHLVQFTPSTDFSGMGSFQFTVTANDGSSYTNTVNVLITPITPPSNLVWEGDGSVNLWANGSGLNWLNGTNVVAFASGDNVTFDDTGSNTPAISLSGPITAGTVYVLSEQDYTFGGTGFLSGGTVLFKTGSGRLTLDTANMAAGGALIDEGILQVGDGVSFNGGLAGNVTNNDTLIYATPGTLSSAVSISGSGSLTETGPGAVTITGTQTYTGTTMLNAGGLTLSGTLPPSDITDNGTLGLSPSGSQVYSNNISGSGSLTTIISGALTLSSSNTFSGNLTNISGFLILSNNQAAGFGTVVCSNGPIVVANGIVITNNFSIPTSTADLNMMATNTGTATWAGNVVNLGSSAQWRPGSDGGTLVFLGNAVMGSRNFIVPRGAVQFGSNAVVSATGGATALGRDGSAGNRSASVTIRDNAALSLGICSLGGGDQGGNVTVTIQNNAALACTGNLDVQNVARATAVTFIRLNGGTLAVNGFTKTKTSQTNSITFNGGILKATAANAAFLPQFNFTTNAVQGGGAIVDDSGFAITIGASLSHDPALGSTPDGGLKKLGAGTLTFVTPQTYTGPTIISNGTLALTAAASSGSINGSPSVSIANGAAFDVSGVLGFSLPNNQTLTGSGTVKGALIAGNGSTITPGPGLTALTFNNSLTLAAGSAAVLQLSHSPLSNDSLAVAGTLSLGGTLTLTNSGGTPFAAGDAFQIFTAGSFNGAFATVILPALSFGLAWNTNSLNTAGTVSVILATTPVIGSISISGNSLGLSGTGGVGNAYYVLLGSTNLDGAWTPLFTNQFDASGNFNFTTNANTGSAQNFYRLQLQ